MAEVIRMPRMSDTMEEGVIVEWHKKVGDTVSPGDLMAEVETDKATMELESYNEGTLLYIGVKKGDAVAVDGILAIVGDKGEDYKTLLAEAEKTVEAKVETVNTKETKDIEKQTEPVAVAFDSPPVSTPVKTAILATNGHTADDRVKASPLAKAMAKEKGISLSSVKGSGDDGRIVKRDIENYNPDVATKQTIQLPSIVAEESSTEIPLSQMRKTIAKRLAQSKFSAPHFYLTMEIEMDKVISERKAINAVSPVKISFNDIIIKATAHALRQNPKVNASWQEDKIIEKQHIHIGVAVAVDEGLLVPVIKFADNKSLSHIAAEVKELAGKAKSKKLQPDEMQGNTFSISNLGMFGIEEFTAIINPPDSCIMAVGGIKEVPTIKNGELVNKSVMKVTISCDHRVIDGATGAKFLQTFKYLLEEPVRLLI